MNTTYFLDLYGYTFWANRRVWGCIEQISEQQFSQELDHSLGSLHAHCLHTMSVESWWIRFLATGTLAFLAKENYPTRASIRAEWDNVEGYVMAYIASLTASKLEREVHPDFWEDDPPVKLWQALIQVANHSTDHRAQILAGLNQLGGPTVSQDFLDYLDETKAKAES